MTDQDSGSSQLVYRHNRGGVSKYLMEDPREGARLVAKVNPTEWATQYINTGPTDSRILDVGCGPMHLLAAAADRMSARIAVGADLSSARLAAGAGRPVETATLVGVVADATALPFAADSFDLSYARFVLEYAADPQRLVSEMVRVTRPNGTVLLQDLDGQLVTHYLPDPELSRMVTAVLESLTGRLDVYTGRKLFSYALKAGLVDIDIRLAPYHLIVGTPDTATLDLWIRKLDIAAPAITNALGVVAAEQMQSRFISYLSDPGTLTFSTLFTVAGTVSHGP